MGGIVGSFSNLIGGGKGGVDVTGGVSPQEAALAEYTTQQREIANASNFSRGMGESTGRTYSDAAAEVGGATQLAGISDANAQAQNSLATIAQQANQQIGGFGTSGGNFGNTDTGGNTGSNPVAT
jgi:hypothetical protein